MTIEFTKAERATIDAASRAIAYLSETTNWSDAGAWAEAIKLERRQGLSMTAAKANCAKAWHLGASDPDKPVRDMFHYRPGYLRAYLLGVRHAVERADSDYSGPLFREALGLCPAAIEAQKIAINRSL